MRGIRASAILSVTLAWQPSAQASDADTLAAAGTPARTADQPANTAAQTPSAQPAPMVFKHTRLYLDRKAPADADAPALDLQLREEDVEWAARQVRYSSEEPSTVEVAGEAVVRGPDIPGGPFAVFWALMHPKQAWRIFTPVQ